MMNRTSSPGQKRLALAVAGLAAIAAGAIVVLYRVEGGPPLPRIDLGNAPGWLAATAGALAVFFASRAARTALKTSIVQQETLELQRQDLERQETRYRSDQQKAQLEERQRQASQVSAWLLAGDDHQILVMYNNFSGQPVTRTTIRFFGPNNDNDVNVGALPPTNEAVILPGVSGVIADAMTTHPWTWEAFVLNVDKETTFRFHEDHEYRKQSLVGESIQLSPVGIELVFTDQSNVRWSRGTDGLLREVSDKYRLVQSGVGI